MKKTRKIIRISLKTLGILLAVLILAAVFLPMIFKKQIVETVKTEINKQLTAKVDFTDIGLNMFRNFPNMTLSIENLSIAGTGAFEKDSLAVIPKLTATLDLFSIFGGDAYEIKKISVENPRIHLIVLKGGQANWDILREEAADTAAATDTAGGSSFQLKLRKLSITGADVVYDDRDGDIYVSLRKLNHSLKGDLSADFATLKTSTSIDSLSFSYEGFPWLSRVNTRLDADIDADLKNSKYTFLDNELWLNDLGLFFEGWVAMPADDIEMDLKFGLKKTDFKNLISLLPALYAGDFKSMEASGNLAFEGFAKGIYNEQSLPAFSLSLLVDKGMFKYPGLQAVTGIGLDVKLSNKDGQPDHTVTDIRKLQFSMGTNAADIRMLVNTPVSDPAIDGRIKVNLDLASVKQYYPLAPDEKLNGKVNADVNLKGRMSFIEAEQYEKFTADGKVEISGMSYASADFPQGLEIRQLSMLFSPRFVEMPYCDLKIGRSDLQCKGRLDNVLAYVFKDELLKGNVDMTSALLDLNEFADGSGESSGEATPESSSPMSVIEVPENLDLSASASISKILYDNMELSNSTGKLKISGGRLLLENFRTELLGGSMTVSGFYATTGPRPEIDFNLSISNFDIPQTYKTFSTVQKFAPVAEKTSGRVGAGLKMAGFLDQQMMPDYGSLNASGNFNASSIVVQGFGVLNEIAAVLKMDVFKKLSLSKISASFELKNGRLELKPHSYSFNGINAEVSGWNALDQTIGYVMALQIPRSLFGGAANQVLNDMTGKAAAVGVNVSPGNTVNVDVVIGGTFSKPTVKAGIKGSMQNAVEDLKNQVQQQVQQEVEQQIDNLKADAEAKCRKLIDNATAQGQKLKDEAKAAGDKLVSEADAQGKKLVDEAKNPITKAAAKETAKKLLSEAQDKSAKLQSEAAQKADKLQRDAQAECDKISKQ